jgi:tRNA-modifying protein YgfZ
MSALLINLSARAKFKLTGADRVRYLNGQVTNDIRTATAERAIYACVTDAKGRIVGDIHVHARDEALFIDAEPGLRDTLAARLERYIVSDDAELHDVTDDFDLWFSTNAEGVANERYGRIGSDLWLAKGRPAPSGSLISSEDAEVMRVLAGVPQWPNELGNEVFPQEAGLEARAMSYTKGCYIGQEILSRIKTTGKMPRTMIRWTSTATPQVGDLIVGHGPITSAVTAPTTGQLVGLAFIKQNAATRDAYTLEPCEGGWAL